MSRLRPVVLGVVFLAAAPCLASEPIPAEPPIGGAWWTVAVPALLFTVALGATVLLYRHFAGRPSGE